MKFARIDLAKLYRAVDFSQEITGFFGHFRSILPRRPISPAAYSSQTVHFTI
jgi:hypothetical protein